MHVVLYDRRKHGMRRAKSDGSRRNVHIVRVFGARRIRLGAAEGPQLFDLVPGLVAEQILNGVKDRRCVRFDSHPVLRPQHVEIERRHHGGDGGTGRLMSADLQPVARAPDVVRVMDHPARQPQYLAFQRPQGRHFVRPQRNRFNGVRSAGARHQVVLHIPSFRSVLRRILAQIFPHYLAKTTAYSLNRAI